MTRMIAQILDFARIRAGMSFELKFLDRPTCIRSADPWSTSCE